MKEALLFVGFIFYGMPLLSSGQSIEYKEKIKDRIEKYYFFHEACKNASKTVKIKAAQMLVAREYNEWLKHKAAAKDLSSLILKYSDGFSDEHDFSKDSCVDLSARSLRCSQMVLLDLINEEDRVDVDFVEPSDKEFQVSIERLKLRRLSIKSDSAREFFLKVHSNIQIIEEIFATQQKTQGYTCSIM